jgi:hypothetical protein
MDGPKVKLTRKRALRLTREWQARLGLKDWVIAVRVEPINGAWGTFDSLPPKRQALIRVDGRAAAPSVRGWPWARADYERTIVHELLHLHLEQLSKRGGHHKEQIIHSLSDALVRLKRRKR